MAGATPSAKLPLVVTRRVVLPVLNAFMGACMLVAATLAATAPIPYAEHYWTMRVGMGYLGIPVSLGIIALNLRQALTRREAIRIDERGITDRSNAMASGFTAYDDLAEIYLLRLKDDDYLCAVPRDTAAWMARLPKRARRLAQANIDMGFAPIRIQFRSVSDALTSKDGRAAVKAYAPQLVTRTRKPRY